MKVAPTPEALSNLEYRILLALAEGQVLTGLTIWNVVLNDARHEIEIGHTTTYRNITKLVERGYIDKLPDENDERRLSRPDYGITGLGREALRREMHRWRELVKLTERRLGDH